VVGYWFIALDRLLATELRLGQPAAKSSMRCASATSSSVTPPAECVEQVKVIVVHLMSMSG
jgi:hypothetical protein